MKYLLIALLIIVSSIFVFGKRSLPLTDSKTVKLKVTLKTETDTWTIGGKMPVNVEITNVSGDDESLKLHSIRFHLVSNEKSCWVTYLVPSDLDKEWKLSVKNDETIGFNYDLSDLTVINYANCSEPLERGKYRVMALIQIIETDYHCGKKIERLRGFDSSVFVNMADKASSISPE